MNLSLSQNFCPKIFATEASMRSGAVQGWHMFKFCILAVAALAGCFIAVSQAQPIPVPMAPASFEIDTPQKVHLSGRSNSGSFLDVAPSTFPLDF